MGTDTSLERESTVWKWVAIFAVMLASWLSGVGMQATLQMLPANCSCKGNHNLSQGSVVELYRRIARVEEEQSREDRELARLRQDFDKHLGSRGLATPTAAAKP